jgi:DNA-binding XRE family transcriptional regulator
LIKLETTSLAELVDIEKKTINKIGFEWNEKG